jgi:hypothetical protein
MPIERILRQNTHHSEDAECDRKVEMAAFLWQVGGCKVDGDPLWRQRQPNRAEGRSHPLAAFGHRFVR